MECESNAAKAALKKGPWTAEEDAVLIEYVNRHGEGNWNSVHKRAGLARCGKSCRLRWANHLRPNLKKGHFTPEEEATILRLHAQMGNKWARMASYLPGRTDNEIKNYWNTRIKRRQRAGLPLYPSEAAQHRHQGTRPRRAHGSAAVPYAGPSSVRLMQMHVSVPGYGSARTSELPSSQLLFGGGGGGGLLDALLQDVDESGGDRRELLPMGDPHGEEGEGNGVDIEKQGLMESATANGSSIVVPTQDMNAVAHDDISKLFDMIQTPTMPALPDWYNNDGDEMGSGAQSVPVVPIEQEWSIGCFPWNNLPEIC